MKYIKSFLIFAVAVFGISAVNVSAQTYVAGKAPTGGIERKIFTEIVTLPHYGTFDQIAFSLDGSRVTLSGKVAVAINKSDAAGVVKRIPGVTEVVNNIEVLPLSPFDDTIRRGILRSFASQGGSLYRFLQEPNPSMRIIVENGHVSLEGYVSNKSDSNLANILANGVNGVFSVNNNLVIAKDKAS